MTAYLIPGVMGLLTGLTLHWAGFSNADGLRDAWGLRRSLTLRSGLTAVGWAMALTALLCWLAVIDVDTIEVLPLSMGALLGGVIFGVASGLCGFTPTTAFAGLGGGRVLESLCVLAGCFAGTFLLPSLDALLAPLQTAPPYVAATLFKVTLDEPFLLDGGFIAQGGVGIAVAAVAAIIRKGLRPVSLEFGIRNLECCTEPEEEQTAEVPEEAVEEQAVEVPDPEATEEGTIVIALEGEEPLVVDAEMDEAEESPPDE